MERIDLVFETYGDYDVISVLFMVSTKRKEILDEVRSGLSDKDVSAELFKVFPVSLEKMDFNL